MIKLRKKPNKLIVSFIATLVLGLALLLLYTDKMSSWFYTPAQINQLRGIYEPSAAAQLGSGQVLVLEDEISRALNILTIGADGSLFEDAIRGQQLNAQLKQKIDDLEGVAAGRSGVIYATTSFTRTNKGKRRPNREKLLKLVFDEEGELQQTGVFTGLADVLKQSEVFKKLRDTYGKQVRWKDVNIEGLSFDGGKQQLLFGFRKPLINDLSLILRLENPQGVFDNNELPTFSHAPILLDLHGGGIRSLAYIEKLKGYLIANEVNYGGGPKQSQLWFWGGGKQQAMSLILPEVIRMENIEAIAAVEFADSRKILLMSDDGSRRNKRPANYLLIDYDAILLQIGS